MRRFARTAIPRLAWLTALGASLFIAVGTAVYFTEEVPPFLLEKLPLPHEDLWLVAVRVHVVSTALALPGCLLLAWSRVLRARRVHRWLGRVTGAVVLVAAAPSGFYLSLFAKGGLPSTVGFALSGVIVCVAMVRAIITARRNDLVAHRRASMHVLAQLAVAVTSRAMLVLFSFTALDETTAYLVALWVPVLGHLLAVELLLPRHTPAPRRNHVALPAAHRPDLGVARLGSIAGS